VDASVTSVSDIGIIVLSITRSRSTVEWSQTTGQ